jgi:hypothetical protein
MNPPSLCTDQDIVEFNSASQGQTFNLKNGGRQWVRAHKVGTRVFSEDGYSNDEKASGARMICSLGSGGGNSN